MPGFPAHLIVRQTGLQRSSNVIELPQRILDEMEIRIEHGREENASRGEQQIIKTTQLIEGFTREVVQHFVEDDGVEKWGIRRWNIVPDVLAFKSRPGEVPLGGAVNRDR